MNVCVCVLFWKEGSRFLSDSDSQKRCRTPQKLRTPGGEISSGCLLLHLPPIIKLTRGIVQAPTLGLAQHL